MILCDLSLRKMLLLGHLIKDPDFSLVNPASIDLRIGATVKVEAGTKNGTEVFWDDHYIYDTSKNYPFWLLPGQFALVATYEHLIVPNGFAVELRLKSSRAREGYDHSLAFWFDPGWNGVGTMEIRNMLTHNRLPLWYGMPFGQMIVHTLDMDAEKPYQGRYQNAASVESSKGDKL